MCGIAGIVGFDVPAAAHADRLRIMQRKLAHRGPDGTGEAFVDGAALACTRLAMVDHDGGAQPMVSPDGRWTLVYSGEVYNHLRLRTALDWPFRTRSDTETVLAAFARWGSACVGRLNGMFSFFVWDHQQQRGFAARDRLGVKPFAYALGADGRELRFASEAKALVAAAGCPPAADPDAVIEYLVAPCFSGVDRSPFAGVRYLPPGHTLSFDRDGADIKRWWSWAPPAADDDDGLAAPATTTLAFELREHLATAVGRTLQADAPLGLFLSGGLDSSAIASYARLPSFTVVFEGQASYDYARSTIVCSDDTPFAHLLRDHLGIAGTDVAVPRAEIAGDLARIAIANDALPAWEQEIAQHRLAQAAARSVKAVLVGDAADETHYGYHFLLDPIATSDPAAILHRLGSVPIAAAWGKDPVAAAGARYRELAEAAGERWSTPRQRVRATTRLIVERWLPRLLHNGDIHTMAASLEARVPFADIDLLQLAQRVPPAAALRDGVEKHVLREALRHRLPERIRSRRKSALPKDQGVQVVYQEEARRVLREPPALVRDMVDLRRLAPLADAPLLTESERAQLFRVICLAHWAGHYDVRSP